MEFEALALLSHISKCSNLNCLMRMKKLITVMTLAAVITGATLALADEATKVKSYPLKTCLVSGEKLGEGGMTPYVFTNNLQEIKLCCKGCLKDFKKQQAKYLKKLDEQVRKEAK